MSSAEQTVLITGAAGFLGRAACAAFTAAGFQVRALVRNPAAAADLQPIARGGIFRCDLPDAIDERALEGEPRALIHAAYETRSASAEQARRTNLKGTEALVRLGRQSAIRQLVFVSSMAAHESAASVYGKTKYELEKLFDRTSDTVIKPATIVGAGGVFQRTREMLRRLPVLPLFYADRRLQTIWIEDICQGLVRTRRALARRHASPGAPRKYPDARVLSCHRRRGRNQAKGPALSPATWRYSASACWSRSASNRRSRRTISWASNICISSTRLTI